MLKTYKYRLYPSDDQAKAIDQTFGVCRLVYNLGMEIKTRAYREHGVSVSVYDLQKQIIDLREAYPWVKSVSREALDASLNNLGRSFEKFFSGSGYPKFRKKTDKQSYAIKGRSVKIDFDNTKISIPKIKGIPIRVSRRFSGDIRTSVVSKNTTGKYFISVLVENSFPIPEKRSQKVGIGIDLGISHFATLSSGEKISNPRFLRKNMKRLKVLQKRVSQKKKGSCNRRKAALKVANLHERILNQRKDFLHKVSSKLVGDSQTDTICLETLSVSGMKKNRSLSLDISDVSWAEFVRQVRYKSEWSGKNVVSIGMFFPSSKMCSVCGHRLNELPLSIREWTCQCGAVHDRDINAAINIRNSGMGSPVEPVEQSEMNGCIEAGINVK